MCELSEKAKELQNVLDDVKHDYKYIKMQSEFDFKNCELYVLGKCKLITTKDELWETYEELSEYEEQQAWLDYNKSLI